MRTITGWVVGRCNRAAFRSRVVVVQIGVGVGVRRAVLVVCALRRTFAAARCEPENKTNQKKAFLTRRVLCCSDSCVRSTTNLSTLSRRRRPRLKHEKIDFLIRPKVRKTNWSHAPANLAACKAASASAAYCGAISSARISIDQTQISDCCFVECFVHEYGTHWQ